MDRFFMVSYSIARQSKLISSSIIQDSPDDWAKEASTMDKVYRNSVCTIAGCESQSSDEGMFMSRDLQSGATIQTNLKFSDRNVSLSILPNWVERVRRYNTMFTRGWILQERLLSQRMIYMSRFPFWECLRSGVRSEACPLGYPDQKRIPDAPHRNYLREAAQTDVALEYWERTVEIYSQTQLTYGSDKLIALAGLARYFDVGIRQKYLAGIWGGSYLLEGLLWKTTGPRNRNRQTEYRGEAYLVLLFFW